MRFTPTSFLGQTTSGLVLSGGLSGSYTSGGINYEFQKFTSNGELVVGRNVDVEMLIVGGGAAGDRTGGGGGGVNYTSTRLYKGKYTVTVATASSTNGYSSSVANAGFNYVALGGASTGSSGNPTAFPPGNDINCGGADVPGGGGAGASQAGFSAICIVGGNGGEGLTYNLDNTASVYGSGGGGRGRATPGGFASGGSGGTNAGNGGSFVAFATSGVNGYGAGGGGAYSAPGSGSSGVVIIRYRTN